MTLIEDIQKLRDELDQLTDTVSTNNLFMTRHEEQISGERGLSASIKDLSNEVKSLRKAAYWVGGVIVAGAITFAFSVMALVG